MVTRSVLLVSHTAGISGAERSMLDLLQGLPGRITPIVACPTGTLADEVAARGIATVPLLGTDAGLKLHPVGTPRALFRLLADGLTILRTARGIGACVMHANSTRAGLACATARALGGPALAVHVHDVLGSDRVSATVRRAIDVTADVVLANSRYVGARLNGRAELVVVDNPVDLARFDPSQADGARVRRELRIRPDEQVLLLVGQITPWKGQDTAIAALARLPERIGAVRLLLVGEPVFASGGTRYDNVAYLESLHRQVRALGVGDRVTFVGPRADVPDLLAAADLALMPSWEEPFGRVAIEAMAMGVPVLATDRGGPAEILEDGGGMVLAPERPDWWATAIAQLLGDRDERARIGSVGRRRAAGRYGLDAFVARVLSGWEMAMRVRASGGGRTRRGRRARAQLRAQGDKPDSDR